MYVVPVVSVYWKSCGLNAGCLVEWRLSAYSQEKISKQNQLPIIVGRPFYRKQETCLR